MKRSYADAQKVVGNQRKVDFIGFLGLGLIGDYDTPIENTEHRTQIVGVGVQKHTF